VTDWIVRRWARFGHERLYAETPGGTALGYLDLKTGRYHSDDLSNLPLLERAISDHLGTVPPTPPTPPSPPVEELEPVELDAPTDTLPATIAAPAYDISATPAGAAAREQALAERAAQGTMRNVLARLTGARTEERAWRIGADGEVAVAQQLTKLGPAWRVMHAVRVGTNGADIDHVVIGPGGVFTINAKHHPNANVWVGGDTVMINGRRVPYVRNSRHEAQRAGRKLSEHAGFPVEAIGIIAVMGAQRGFTIKQQPEDQRVVVVQRRRISQHLRSRRPRLTAREVDAIFEVARLSSTWC
jgi:hypothetical protein